MEMQYVTLLELKYKDISNEAEKIYGLELIRGMASFKLFTKTKSLHETWARHLKLLTIQEEFELRFNIEKELYEKEKGVIYAFAHLIQSPDRTFIVKFIEQATLVADIEQVGDWTHLSKFMRFLSLGTFATSAVGSLHLKESMSIMGTLPWSMRYPARRTFVSLQ